jgi:hypothetical protein
MTLFLLTVNHFTRRVCASDSFKLCVYSCPRSDVANRSVGGDRTRNGRSTFRDNRRSKWRASGTGISTNCSNDALQRPSKRRLQYPSRPLSGRVVLTCSTIERGVVTMASVPPWPLRILSTDGACDPHGQMLLPTTTTTLPPLECVECKSVTYSLKQCSIASFGGRAARKRPRAATFPTRLDRYRHKWIASWGSNPHRGPPR